MNPETIKYLRALQPMLRERMGAPRYGDRGYHIEMCTDVYVVQNNGETTNVIYNGHETVKDAYTKNILRTPLAIDPENSERGLWGMVDWDELLRKQSHVKTLYQMLEQGPYLALLKALAAQWGVEVKG